MSFLQDCEATNLRALQAGEKVAPHKVTCGLFLANTGICFEKMEGSGLNLTGKSKGKVERTQIINPDWDFSKMGIGGLDTQFNAIFRLIDEKLTGRLISMVFLSGELLRLEFSPQKSWIS